ncbi:uncharacterized protein LOC107495538 [Arachis duranensis]|uniref:Uncharacterized protein LOC107495538 n=1 Tax=Arachis duranensis TaxID=130453 RepID=A0A6P5M9A1_ARADU|nr:uncharacterized protein LOC107495538 [Arachis duranensis]
MANDNILKREAKSLSVIECATTAAAAATEVETVSAVKCCCCGLVEECTEAYITRVKERYVGRWICGLCGEAVKDERLRSRNKSEDESIMMTMDEAIRSHMKFCQQFRSSISPPNNPTEEFIIAVKNILFRTLDSPRKDSFNGCRPLGRSQSCFSTIQATTTKTTTTTSQDQTLLSE